MAGNILGYRFKYLLYESAERRFSAAEARTLSENPEYQNELFSDLSTRSPGYLEKVRKQFLRYHETLSEPLKRLNKLKQRKRELHDRKTATWAAASFMDTLLRWKMEPEVTYGNETAVQQGVQA